MTLSWQKSVPGGGSSSGGHCGVRTATKTQFHTRYTHGDLNMNSVLFFSLTLFCSGSRDSNFVDWWTNKGPASPEASMAIGHCRCLRLFVRPCVNHLLVRAIPRDPFKLGSPHLNHECKRPWLRSLLFCGVTDFYLLCQIYLRIKIYPILSLSVRYIITRSS